MELPLKPWSHACPKARKAYPDPDRGQPRRDASLSTTLPSSRKVPSSTFPLGRRCPQRISPPAPTSSGNATRPSRTLSTAKQPHIILSSLQACLQKLIPPASFDKLYLNLKKGDSFPFDDLIATTDSRWDTKGSPSQPTKGNLPSAAASSTSSLSLRRTPTAWNFGTTKWSHCASTIRSGKSRSGRSTEICDHSGAGDGADRQIRKALHDPGLSSDPTRSSSSTTCSPWKTDMLPHEHGRHASRSFTYHRRISWSRWIRCRRSFWRSSRSKNSAKCASAKETGRSYYSTDTLRCTRIDFPDVQPQASAIALEQPLLHDVGISISRNRQADHGCRHELIEALGETRA